MEDEREIILAAARKRFHEGGMKGVSLEEIASDVGVNTAVVFAHFPERLELIFTIFQEELVSVAQRAMETLPDKDIAVQLKHLLQLRLAFFSSHRQSASEVMCEVFFSREGWREAYDTMLWRLSIGVVALFQAAKRRGEIRQDADETLAGQAFVSYYLSGMLMVMHGDFADAKAACDFSYPLVDALVASLQ